MVDNNYEPPTYNFKIVRGTTNGLILRLKTTDGSEEKVPLEFDDVRLSVYRQGGALLFRKSIGDGIEVTDPGEGEVTWQPTAAETRSLPLNKPCMYEVEVRIGETQDVYMQGTICGVGGLNDDA